MGELTLEWGSDAAVGIWGSGLFSCALFASWGASLQLALDSDKAAVTVTLGGWIAAFVVPLVVLRMRQRSAKITWDDHGVTEWDGDARRTFIAWEDARASCAEWVEKSRRYYGVQIVDTRSHASIELWTTEPYAALPARRRRVVRSVEPLRDALLARSVPIDATPDWSRASEPDRPRGWFVHLGRFAGYPAATIAPMATDSIGLSLGLLSLAVIGLTVRTYPAWFEWRALGTRTAAIESPTAPYRGSEERDPALVAVDRARRRPVAIELAVRVALPIATIAVTAATLLFRPIAH